MGVFLALRGPAVTLVIWRNTCSDSIAKCSVFVVLGYDTVMQMSYRTDVPVKLIAKGVLHHFGEYKPPLQSIMHSGVSQR